MRHCAITFLICFVILTSASAQTDFYRQELLNLGDLSRLPLYRTGDMEQLSSYDRTGANDDGFSGKYSAVREEPGGKVIADLKGPGVVNRIWTPTPTADTIKFYFDGEKKPRLAVPFISLFTGKDSPFLAPLCGNEIGGFYCYLPLPYEKSLKIVFAGKNLRFHQTQYRTLRKEDNVKSFTMEMFTRHKDSFEQVAALWSGNRTPLEAYGTGVKTRKLNLLLKSGQEQSIFSTDKGGRIVGIEMGAGSDLLQANGKIQMRARWDGESDPALDLPLHNFFGFAFNKPSVRSIVLGSGNQKLYSYLPMPFDNSADVMLKYDKRDAGDPDEILISGTVYYTEEKRNDKTEGKLYIQARRDYNIASAVPHTIADIQGRGHYIGTVLITQGLEAGNTGFFEGDDQTTIDGKLKMHGTGSEDYFNGGYYAVMDKWDRGMSLPIHGALEYDLMTSRTGGYRFYLSDKLNFNQSFKLTIEHQPEAPNNVKTDYTSMGIFYADKPKFKNTSLVLDEKVAKVSHRDKLTPQGMIISLYWLATASYEDPSIVFSLRKSDVWNAKIDIEAIPIAQVYLDGLDNGRYKCFVEYGKTPSASPFTIWQSTRQISDWLGTDKDLPAEGGKTVYAGDIEITDEVKTITLRKKVDEDATIRIYSFQFERIE